MVLNYKRTPFLVAAKQIGLKIFIILSKSILSYILKGNVVRVRSDSEGLIGVEIMQESDRDVKRL